MYLYVYSFFCHLFKQKFADGARFLILKRQKQSIFLNPRMINFGKNESPLGTCFEKLKWVTKLPYICVSGSCLETFLSSDIVSFRRNNTHNFKTLI